MNGGHGSTPLECDALVDYLLGELSAEQMESFAAHLKTCLHCQEEWASLQRVHSALAEEELSQGAFDDTDTDLTAAQWADLKARTMEAALAARPSPMYDSTQGDIEASVNHEERTDFAPPDRLREAVSVTDESASVNPVEKSGSARFLADRRRPVSRIGRRARLGIGVAAVAVIVFLLVVVQGVNGTPAWMNRPLRMEASSAFPDTHGMLTMKQQSNMMQLTLQLQQVPPAPANGCYELWIVTPSGKHIGYGEFVPKANGEATVTALVPQSLAFVSVGVTREPQWGDKKPLGKMVVRMQMDQSV